MKAMADTSDHGAEIKAHAETYSGFTKLMLWGTIVCAAIGAFVVLMIAS